MTSEYAMQRPFRKHISSNNSSSTTEVYVSFQWSMHIDRFLVKWRFYQIIWLFFKISIQCSAQTAQAKHSHSASETPFLSPWVLFMSSDRL